MTEPVAASCKVMVVTVCVMGAHCNEVRGRGATDISSVVEDADTTTPVVASPLGRPLFSKACWRMSLFDT